MKLVGGTIVLFILGLAFVFSPKAKAKKHTCTRCSYDYDAIKRQCPLCNTSKYTGLSSTKEGGSGMG